MRTRVIQILILTLLGLAANAVRLHFFLEIDFIFGSFLAMFILLRFGLLAGVISGANIASFTWFLWDHPYAIVIFTMEVLTAGLFVRRYEDFGIVLWDTLYWLFLGVPLVTFFYSLPLGLLPVNVGVIVIKQAVKGVLNTALAMAIHMALTVFTARYPRAGFINAGNEVTSLPSIRSFFSIALVLLVLPPVIATISHFTRLEANRFENEIVQQVERAGYSATRIVSIWEQDLISTMNAVVDQVGDRPEYGIYAQRPTDSEPVLIGTFHQAFHRIGTVDRDGNIVALGQLRRGDVTELQQPVFPPGYTSSGYDNDLFPLQGFSTELEFFG